MRKVLLALVTAVLLAPAVAKADAVQDEATANDVARNLKYSGQMHNYKVGVAVRNGTAWLTGNVANADQLATAIEIAQATPGVEHVVSRLEIAAARPARQRQTLSNRLQESLATLPRNSKIRLASTSQRLSDGRAQYGSRRAPEPPNPVAGQAASARGAVRYNRPPRSAGAPMPYARLASQNGEGYPGQPIPAYTPGTGRGIPARFDHAHMPNYSWPSYAAYPNYAALTYPRQYSPTAWPYIGPFYPYPQVPLGWRKVSLEWDDGWWMLDFRD